MSSTRCPAGCDEDQSSRFSGRLSCFPHHDDVPDEVLDLAPEPEPVPDDVLEAQAAEQVAHDAGLWHAA